MNVLFLSLSAGGGNNRAAEVLKEHLERKHPSAKILIIDALKYASPVINNLVIGSYLGTLKSTPSIYGKFYEFSEIKDNLSGMSNTINKVLSLKIKELIQSVKPSVVVCTHHFALHMLSNLKKKGFLSAPIAAIMTDFTVHNSWIHENVDAYVVANEILKCEMTLRGVPENIVYPFGIPVSKEFSAERDRPLILKELGLQDKLTVLVAGGSLGYGDIKDVVCALLQSAIDMQIIVLTGWNSKLKRKLNEYSAQSSKVVKVLGYTHEVADLMSASDLIITKPGGLTVSEALVKHLPIFLMSPIPGHEEKNADFLLNHGAAIKISRYETIETALRILLDNPLRRQQMIEAAKHLARPYATRDTAILLETLAGCGC